jgi:glutamine amidotransferase-like uncharacterized protein
MVNIAIYKHHPYCSIDSSMGIADALSIEHKCIFFNENKITLRWLQQFDMVVFPGGIGDANSFEWLLSDKTSIIRDYVIKGGKYLGICMGAYWAGSNYFNLLNKIEPVQYIKQPNAEIRRPYGTVAEVEWLGKSEAMYFYDGCCFKGKGVYDTIAKYKNDQPMAIIQNNVGAIGCHPESYEYWYDTWSYMPEYWHDGKHHKLLLNFVDKLLVS